MRDRVINKGNKLSMYTILGNDVDLNNLEFQKIRSEFQALSVQLDSEIAFFETDILAMEKTTFDNYIKAEPRLKTYALTIEKILVTKPHVLPEEQEKIYLLAGLFSDKFAIISGILNNMEIPSPEVTLPDGTKVLLNYANYVRYRASKDASIRALVNQVFWDNMRKYENTFAALLDAEMKRHLYNAMTHKYKDCLEAKLSEDYIDTAVYHKMIEQVRKNLDPYHRYLKLKKELLGLKVLKYDDVNAPSVPNVTKVFSYEEAQQILLQVFSSLGDEYVKVVKNAFDSRWVDRYSNKNKIRGAYSSSTYGIHPYIFMNFDGQYENVSTLAHEFGHAMHSYFSSKTQAFTDSAYPTFLAEIASTFNEHLLMNYLLQHEKDDLFKLYILDSYMQRVKGSIYRQSHFSEFELAMHRQVEAGNSLTADWLNKTYLDLVHFYYGHEKGVMEVNDYIQHEWETVPHFYLDYYVYTYSTGMIASAALVEMVTKGGKNEQEKYLNFLKSGANGYPLDILKTAGVDIKTDAPYDAAFKHFGDIVTEMEKIVARLKSKGILK